MRKAELHFVNSKRRPSASQHHRHRCRRAVVMTCLLLHQPFIIILSPSLSAPFPSQRSLPPSSTVTTVTSVIIMFIAVLISKKSWLLFGRESTPVRCPWALAAAADAQQLPSSCQAAAGSLGSRSQQADGSFRGTLHPNLSSHYGGVRTFPW